MFKKTVALAVLTLLGSIGEPAASTTDSGPVPGPTTIMAVGDIGLCSRSAEVAKVAERISTSTGPVALLGDTAYPSGSADNYANCFDPYYRSFKDRLRPAVGNHEYLTPDAAGYYEYFGDAAGDPTQGWYAYDAGSWRIIVLNSMCGEVGGCDVGSPQHEWLTAELDSNADDCRIAYWHHPRFTSSSAHGNATATGPLVELLYEADTEAILAGHAHHYERFARLDPDGYVDPDGIRFFVVGTGGVVPRPFGATEPGSEVRETGVNGALELTLGPGSLRWDFSAIDDDFRDHGEQVCEQGTDDPELVALYRATFGRPPDLAGLEYWAEVRGKGLSFEQIAVYFAASPEFDLRFGAPTDEGFVDLVYRNVLGRAPDSAGKAYWLGILEGVDRSAILVYFSRSEEFQNL